MSDQPSPFVESAEERPLEAVPRTRGAYKAVLVGEESGAPRFEKRRFVLESGGRIPAHRHPEIEHEQYVLDGEMRLELDGDTVVVREGDVVFIPAGTVHAYENTGDQSVEFLCTVPVTDDYETDWLEELEGAS